MAKNAKPPVEKAPVPVEEKKPAGKFPLKTMIVLAAVLLIEAAAISAAFYFAGGPTGVQAEGPAEDKIAEGDKAVELLVIEDRFPNNKRGRTYLYDSRMVLVVRKKNEEAVKKELEQTKEQITDDVRTLISRAEPSQLLEPTLATLRRQIAASLDRRLSLDEQGKSRVEEVLIPKFIQIKVDG